jgi:hypothetical protein
MRPVLWWGCCLPFLCPSLASSSVVAIVAAKDVEKLGRNPILSQPAANEQHIVSFWLYLQP